MKKVLYSRHQLMLNHHNYPPFSLTKRCIYKKIHYLTFDFDLGVQPFQNILTLKEKIHIDYSTNVHK